MEKPKLKLVGMDGNAYFILGRARKALRDAGYPAEEIEKFHAEATSGDYDHLLATCMDWFDTDGDEDGYEDPDEEEED